MPKTDQGVFSDHYSVIPRTLIFATWERKVLLLKGAATKRLWANRYNGIGGHVERGEDVLTAARREWLEETGLEPSNLWLCGTLLVDASEQTGIAIYIFRCDYSGGVPPRAEPSSEGSLEWVDRSALSDLPLVEDLPQLLPAVLAANPSQPVFAARSYYDEHDQLRVVIRN